MVWVPYRPLHTISRKWLHAFITDFVWGDQGKALGEQVSALMVIISGASLIWLHLSRRPQLRHGSQQSCD